MDITKLYKVVKTPTAHGVVVGITGEVLYEFESSVAAQSAIYQLVQDDTSVAKGVHYTYDLVEWRG